MNPTMVPRELLKKYMDRVSAAEGVFFIPLAPDSTFTAAEVSTLEEVAAELRREDAARNKGD